MKTLGIDVSTQGVKAVVYDDDTKRVISSANVNFGRDFPHYGAPDGFLANADVHVRQANPLLWLAGLELVLSRLQASGAPMNEIAAIGGDAQQHATVYLARQGLEKLTLGRWGDLPTAEWFSREVSPIWMDSSTTAEVAELEERFGTALRARTGSPATERFAAAQIMKFRREAPQDYENTERIHLLSSFLTSYLTASDAPIEFGDGAGMNLVNLKTRRWDDEIVSFVAPDLMSKLPRLVESNVSCARPLAMRFVKYGFRAGIPVVPFTGDNPASLVGCGAAQPGCAVISLGTSDTFFAAMASYRVDPEGYGNVFGNPLGGFMSLSCFKNGSLARDRVRRELGVDWKFFDETAFAETPHGNDGKRAFPYFETEITPRHAATGIEANFDWNAAMPSTKIRAVIEGQIANMRERTHWIGDFDVIFVTGGASRSAGIRQVIVDQFGAQVKQLEIADSAALGGALLAAQEVRS